MQDKKQSPEAREKTRLFMLENNPFKGKKHTEETKAKMRAKRALYSSSTLGKHWRVSEQAKVNIKKTRKKGAEHPNWKGGVTSQNDMDRAIFKKTYQKQILARDNYTCQICNQYSGNLQVDHIKKWSDFPELRFDIDNCRTLCMACHYYVTFKRKIPAGVIWGHNFNKRVVS